MKVINSELPLTSQWKSLEEWTRKYTNWVVREIEDSKELAAMDGKLNLIYPLKTQSSVSENFLGLILRFLHLIQSGPRPE